jgi:hypothetical protein
LFDPSKADGNKAGTTGSHVQRSGPHPEIVGGNMWSNRDIYGRLAQQQLPGGHVNGCAASAQENGHDVVYVTASEPTSAQPGLYRYELAFLEHPELDRMDKVGSHQAAASGQTACSYDPEKRLFVRTGDKTAPFLFWDLNTAGASNGDRRVEIDPSIAAFVDWLAQNALSISTCGMDFDPVRKQHVIWCGKGTLWALQSPSANVAHGWSIEALQPAGSVSRRLKRQRESSASEVHARLDVYSAWSRSPQRHSHTAQGWRAPADGSAGVGPDVDRKRAIVASGDPQAAEATAVAHRRPLQQGVNGYQGTATSPGFVSSATNYGSDPSSACTTVHSRPWCAMIPARKADRCRTARAFNPPSCI